MEKTALILPTVSSALSNATSGVTNARNEVTDLYHWSPGNCNSTTSAATWCYTAKEMISDGTKLEHATSSTRDTTVRFIGSSHTEKHINTLMHEQNIYDALVSAWHQPDFNFSDVRGVRVHFLSSYYEHQHSNTNTGTVKTLESEHSSLFR